MIKKAFVFGFLIAVAGGFAQAKEKEIKTFSGKVDVTKAISQKISDKGALFVYVRKLGIESGPPVAVIKIENPKYPQNFVINPENSMIPSQSVSSFSGKYVLFARHSESGEAMAKEGFIGKFDNKNKGVEVGESFPTILIDSKYSK